MNTIAAFFLIIAALILPQSAFAQAATLSLTPSSGTFNRSCNFTLDIRLDTAGAQTDGTDAILIYDSSRFSATSITSGNIYPDYPGNSIDDTSGKITISGLASISSAFSGQGSLATVNFTVKENAPTGATQVKFDFDSSDKAKTTDSNVVQRGTASDILNSVVNGSYTIGTGSCVAGAVSPTSVPRGAPSVSTPSATTQPAQPKNLDEAVGGKTGSVELTYTLVIVGSVLVVLGILGLTLL